MECRLYPHKKVYIASILDTLPVSSWAITAFHLPDTWAHTQGEGVTVGVLDTGCDLDHPDLTDNIETGYNVLDPTHPPIDDNDHGTHIIGSICATNKGMGIVGVAPKVKAIPIKVLDRSGIGDMTTVAKGIRYAVERKVDIMSISLGSARPYGPLRKAIQAASKMGIPIFCAGGNIKKEMDVLYPARYQETIAIGAIDKNYHRADFSNTGKHNVDFLAPGVDILSTVRKGYAILSGSSTAVPFAVGVAALALSAKRQNRLRVALDTVEDYRNLLREHGVNLSLFSGDRIFAGHGIIQPEQLVDWVLSQPSSL